MLLKGKRSAKKLVAKLMLIFVFVASFVCICGRVNRANAMPFYALEPEKIILRSQFYTSYPTSSEERKSNILLAAKSLNGTLVASGEEFSFNLTVGERTVKRGYKTAKIIVGGEFVDGVGGGVCQVSTTLYNAVLLAGLKIIEYHPHSLPVSYVAPSFDAMVNSAWADFRFINDTKNPIIIITSADGERLTIKIYGQKLEEKIVRKSVVTEEIPAPENLVVYDDSGEFPDLYEGESRVLKYGAKGYKSEGYLLISKNGKTYTKKLRSDKYAPLRGKTVFGKAIRPVESEEESQLD
jgi:vancomycin resistance protein YoaR